MIWLVTCGGNLENSPNYNTLYTLYVQTSLPVYPLFCLPRKAAEVQRNFTMEVSFYMRGCRWMSVLCRGRYQPRVETTVPDLIPDIATIRNMHMFHQGGRRKFYTNECRTHESSVPMWSDTISSPSQSALWDNKNERREFSRVIRATTDRAKTGSKQEVWCSCWCPAVL